MRLIIKKALNISAAGGLVRTDRDKCTYKFTAAGLFISGINTPVADKASKLYILIPVFILSGSLVRDKLGDELRDVYRYNGCL